MTLLLALYACWLVAALLGLVLLLFVEAARGAPARALFLVVFLALVPSASADFGEATTAYNVVGPALSTDVSVPSTIALRYVFGDITVSASALTAGRVDAEVKVACAGTAKTLVVYQQPAGLGTARRAYAFAVGPSDCYRFQNVADPVAGNALGQYSYVDVAAEAFEGQVHANDSLVKDPVTVSANDALLGGRWNISLNARWDNGTARTGAATNFSLTVVRNGTIVVDRQNPREFVSPGGQVFGHYYLNGTADVLGDYSILVTYLTQKGEMRNAPASTFRVKLPEFNATDVPHGLDWSPMFERLDDLKVELKGDVGEVGTRASVYQANAAQLDQETLRRFDTLQGGLLVGAGVVLLIILARTRSPPLPRRPGAR